MIQTSLTAIAVCLVEAVAEVEPEEEVESWELVVGVARGQWRQGMLVQLHKKVLESNFTSAGRLGVSNPQVIDNPLPSLYPRKVAPRILPLQDQYALNSGKRTGKASHPWGLEERH